ncbi:MAG: SHOCT domain-containing protein [bacterium]
MRGRPLQTKVHVLLEKGVLTQDEFDTKKRALLNA